MIEALTSWPDFADRDPSRQLDFRSRRASSLGDGARDSNRASESENQRHDRNRAPRPDFASGPWGDQNLVAADPADAARVRSHLKPLVLPVQHFELGAVARRECSWSFIQWTLANHRLASNDNCLRRVMCVVEGPGEAAAQQ